MAHMGLVFAVRFVDLCCCCYKEHTHTHTRQTTTQRVSALDNYSHSRRRKEREPM